MLRLFVFLFFKDLQKGASISFLVRRWGGAFEPILFEHNEHPSCYRRSTIFSQLLLLRYLNPKKYTLS